MPMSGDRDCHSREERNTDRESGQKFFVRFRPLFLNVMRRLWQPTICSCLVDLISDAETFLELRFLVPYDEAVRYERGNEREDRQTAGSVPQAEPKQGHEAAKIHRITNPSIRSS